jgi:hypothetical protein
VVFLVPLEPFNKNTLKMFAKEFNQDKHALKFKFLDLTLTALVKITWLLGL